jgi:hypothetical protein
MKNPRRTWRQLQTAKKRLHKLEGRIKRRPAAAAPPMRPRRIYGSSAPIGGEALRILEEIDALRKQRR